MNTTAPEKEARAQAQKHFGRMLTAMVTPMTSAGDIDYDGVQSLATFLADNGHDGLVVNGTTGESATTTDEENFNTVSAVVEAVGDRVRVVAGVGTNDTNHSCYAAEEMAKRGAHGALIVTPYYNKPTQAGIIEHVRHVAEAAGLPAMLYDIPGRTAMPLQADTIRALAEIPQVKALKDAKGDIFTSSVLMNELDLLWYSGDDPLNLSWLAQGAVGMVSVTGHVAGKAYREMMLAMDEGDVSTARDIHAQLIPVVQAMMFTSQGAIMAKAAMAELGVIRSNFVRLPLLPAAPADIDTLWRGMENSGLYGRIDPAIQ